MTSTTEHMIELRRDTLTLVTVSPDYYRTGDQNGTWNDTGEASRTFYATASTNMGEQWGIVVTGPDDPRGGWALSAEERERLGVGEGHKGWNLQRRYLSLAEPTSVTPDAEPVAVGDRVRVSDSHPSQAWRGVTGTVTEVRSGGATYGPTIILRLEEGGSGIPTGATGGFSLEHIVKVAPDAPVGAPETGATGEGGTFTQADVDRLVSEAVSAAKREATAAMEEFKHAANERAVEYAETNGLCSEFERCMEDIGLLGREEWHDQHDDEYEVTMTFTYSTTVRARDQYDAEEKVDNEEVWPSYVSDLEHLETRVEPL